MTKKQQDLVDKAAEEYSTEPMPADEKITVSKYSTHKIKLIQVMLANAVKFGASFMYDLQKEEFNKQKERIESYVTDFNCGCIRDFNIDLDVPEDYPL